jgi:hypothetical protein
MDIDLTLILSTHLYFYLPSGVYISDVRTNNLYASSCQWYLVQYYFI